MDFLKTLMAYMAATLVVAVESTSTPSVTPVPTPGPEPTRIIATAEPTEEPTATPEPTVSVTPVPVPTITPNTKAYHNIALKARGAEVRRIQERLIELGYLPEGSADGVYGRQTANAVRRFQYYNGLTQDGIAGRTTQTNLFENPDAARYPQESETPAPEETAGAEETPAPAGTPGPENETPAPAEPTETEAALTGAFAGTVPASETPAEETTAEPEKTESPAEAAAQAAPEAPENTPAAAEAQTTERIPAGATYEERAALRRAEEQALAEAPDSGETEETPVAAGRMTALRPQEADRAEAADEDGAGSALAETVDPETLPEGTEMPAAAGTEQPEETPMANSAEMLALNPADASERAAAETPAVNPTENAQAEKPEEAPSPAPETIEEIENVDLDAAEATAAPVQTEPPVLVHYQDLAGWIVVNDSGEALQWTETEDGTPAVRSPRMQRSGEDIRISLDDMARSLEGWRLTDEGHSIVLEAEGHTLALLNEHAGPAATADGAEMTVDVNDFDFSEGHFIRAVFLAEALDGECSWDEEEETLTLRIPEKNASAGAE